MTGTGSIHGIPVALPKLTSFLSCIEDSEKFVEQVIRVIQNEDTKPTKTTESDVDFDLERKDFSTNLNNLRRGNIRLGALCDDKGIDTRTKREYPHRKTVTHGETNLY